MRPVTGHSILISSVTAGHEIESEAGVCKKKKWRERVRTLSLVPSPSLQSLAIELGDLGDLTVRIFLGNGPWSPA